MGRSTGGGNGCGYWKSYLRLTSSLEQWGAGSGPGGFPWTSWITFSFSVSVGRLHGASYLEIGSLGNQEVDEQKYERTGFQWERWIKIGEWISFFLFS